MNFRVASGVLLASMICGMVVGVFLRSVLLDAHLAFTSRSRNSIRETWSFWKPAGCQADCGAWTSKSSPGRSWPVLQGSSSNWCSHSP